jgi:hypothetical protein
MKSLLLLILSSTYALSQENSELYGSILTTYVWSSNDTLVLAPGAKFNSNSVATKIFSQWSAKIPGATWIWSSETLLNPNTYQYCKFFNYFQVNNKISSAILELAAENQVFTLLNGVPTGCSSTTSTATLSTQLKCDVTKFIDKGMNIITFRVNNMRWNASGSNGYAGLLYKLTITTIISSN